jgi:hypothetical protein
MGGDPAILCRRRRPPTAHTTGRSSTTPCCTAQPVRMVAAWMPLTAAGAKHQVLVQVAETLNKRSRLAWEILASVWCRSCC